MRVFAYSTAATVVAGFLLVLLLSGCAAKVLHGRLDGSGAGRDHRITATNGRTVGYLRCSGSICRILDTRGKTKGYVE